MTLNPLLIFALLIGAYLINSVKILNEYERGVIFRLGKLFPRPKGPGVILVFAPIDRMVRVGLRTIVMDVPPQDVITKDNVSVKVNAVVYFRVMDPLRAIVEVENYHYATSQLAQTTLRSVLGQVELDGLLSEREQLNQELQQILDTQTDPWGVKVSAVEVKHVDLPPDMQRAMARQACSAPGFLDSGLKVITSTRPRPARRNRVALGLDSDSRTSPASTVRCTSA